MGDGTGVESCLVCSFCPLFRSGQSLHQTEGVIGRQLAIIAPLETGKVWWAHEGGYCFYEAMAAEMLAVAMLPEDSRKKFRSVFYSDTELVRHGFIHARSAPQGIGQRCSRTLLLPSGGLCFP